MRIFTFYMARRFFMPFLFGLGLFAILIFLGDMFDKMNHLVKSSASLFVIFQYLWLEVPYWTIRVIPMATLLATLIAITGFIQSGEWIAAQASGFQTRDFWWPVLACSLAVGILSFAAQETILPACYSQSQRLWHDKIHPEWEWNRYYNVSLIGGPGEFIEAKVFLAKEGRLERPTLEIVGDAGVASQLDARLALWEEPRQRWVFYDGVERIFSAGSVREAPFAKRESVLTAPPRQLIPRARNPEEMSLRELRRYIEGASHQGISIRELKVALHNKMAYPFTNFVICALGIPVALRLRRTSKVVNFCAALGLSFLYLWVSEIARALGAAGDLSPLAAAWAANVVFGTLALAMIRRYEA